jgi:enamine deaminase RidA (YjgF/YER057c/UK114 family)
VGQYTQHTPTTDQRSSNGFPDLNIKQNQSHSKASLTRLVENTLDSLSRRIGEAGNNVKDIVLLAVVLQSVRGRGSPEMKDRWMTQGAKKALSACRQYLLPAVTDQHSNFGVRKMHHAWGIGLANAVIVPTAGFYGSIQQQSRLSNYTFSSYPSATRSATVVRTSCRFC